MPKLTGYMGRLQTALSIFTFTFLLVSLLFQINISPARAEGSKELVSSGTGKRALTEWRIDTTAGLYRRTFFRVYAATGENILMGSSAMGLGLGDIVIYQEGQISNSQIAPAALNAITPTFRCSIGGAGLGVLRGATPALTRSMELQGATTNGGGDGGYIPCVYTVPANGTGTYWVAMYGPLGVSASGDGNAGTIAAPVINTNQASGVSVWDITVRAGSPLTGVNKPGRVFVDYLAQITGGNGIANQVFSSVFATTADGYVYQVDLNGLDPYGYILYGNRVGFLDPDGKTPLYHDVVTTNNQLTNPAAGVTLPPASARIFFSNPLLSNDLPASILPLPIGPAITNVDYIGSAGGVTGYRPIGGQFTFTSNVGGISEIIISLDGVDFQPDTPANRVIRSQVAVGANIVNWDGKDNTGAFFPVGNGYKYKLTFHAGEYHFPLLDAENSPNGGPTLTLLNPVGGVCPFNPNCHTGFYDDRGYRVSTGAVVGTVGATLPGDVNSINPPSISHADDVNGFDTSSNQRAWGDNANASQSGFGNWKGLDLWAYIPVGPFQNQLNVIDAVTQDLRINKSHSVQFIIGTNGGSFNIDVSNAGTAAISGPITVTDTLPAGLTPVTATTPTGSGWNACTIVGQLVTCVHPNGGAGLAVGGSLQPITLTVNVSLTAAPGVTNTASVSNANDTNPSNDQSSDPVTINSADIAVEKSVLPAVVKQGDSVTFTIKATNNGPSDATNVQLTDVLPLGLTYVSHTASQGTYVSNNGVWSVGALPNTAFATLNITATVDQGTAASLLTNTAARSASSPPDPNPANDSSNAVVTVINPLIQIVKTPASQNVLSGGSANFTLTVTNPGDSNLTNIVVTDALCSVGPTYVSGDSNTNATLETTETWVYDCKVNNITESFTNRADVSGTPPVSTAVTDNDTAAVTVIGPAIKIVKTPAAQTVITGSNVNFTLTVTNPGDVSLTNIIVTDALCDVGPTYISGDANTINTLEVTETWIYSCTVNNVTTDFTNSTDVNGTPPEGSAVTDNDQATVNVIGQVDLSLTKTVNNPSSIIGDVVIFTITLTNQSSTTATNVVVADVLPAGLTFNSAAPSIGTFDNTTGEWTIANLAANTSETLLLNTTVFQVGLITNIAEIIALDQADIDSIPNNHIPTEDDQASVSIGTIFDPPTGIKSFSEAGLPQLEFRLVWINSSNAAAINTQVTDNIPAGTTYVAGSLVCTPQGSSANAGAATPPLNTTLSNPFCAFDPAGNSIQWQGSIGPDNGNFTEDAAANEIVLTFRVTVNDSVNQVFNFGSSRTDTDADTDFTDENVLGASLVLSNQVIWNRGLSVEPEAVAELPKVLPQTGFAPNVITTLPQQPANQVYAATDMRLEIPGIQVNIPIVGVPLVDKGWNVSWLSHEAGWLNGTAFPGWLGNSVVTGHISLPDGKPGPFAGLGSLAWGDTIILRAYGSIYTYEVRENRTISPFNTSVLKHEEEAWLTLLTCKTYNEKTGAYSNRIAVRAILLKVEPEKSPVNLSGRR